MWSSFDSYFSDEEEEQQENIDLRFTRRKIRNTTNLLSLSDKQYIVHFRLNKSAVLQILDITKDDYSKSVRNIAVGPLLKICASLRFLATGSYQQNVGNDMLLGLSQPCFSKVLAEFLDIMEQKICPLFIKTRMTESEQQEAKLFFFEKSGIRNVIMAIDGTHIRIIAPKKEIRHAYLNRKGFYSLNTLVACDHNNVFRFVDARYPGSNHDAFIWSLSKLRNHMVNTFQEDETILLGDAGYPQENMLLTPYRNPSPASQEQHFNRKHSQGRCIIQRSIGILKGRFRCLLGARELHYTPSKATQMTNVCVALHNICRAFNLNDDNIEVVEAQQEIPNEYNGIEERSALSVRDSIRDNLQ